MRRRAAARRAEAGLGTELVPAEVDLSAVGAARVRLAAQLLRAAVAAEAARGPAAARRDGEGGPQEAERWAV